MQALRKKLEGALQEERNTRDADHEKLLQRYQNVKKELDTQHNLERARLETQIQKSQLANQTSLSYGMKKATHAYSSKGFEVSPSRSKTWNAANTSAGPASKPSNLD